MVLKHGSIATLASAAVRSSALWWLVVAATLAPLWVFRYFPSADLPNHLAISRVIEGLLRNDELVSAYYGFNLQLVPYHLPYLLLTPWVALLGPLWGATLFMTLVGLLYFAAIRRLVRLLDCSAAALPASGCLFYDASFAWGFVGSFLAKPLILWGAVFLLRFRQDGERLDLVLACVLGALVTTAHVGMLPAWGAFLLAFLLLDPRRLLVPALITGMASLAPALPWLVASIAGPARDLHLGYEGPALWLHQLEVQLKIFGHGLGHDAMAALTLLFALGALVALGIHIRRQRGHPTGKGALARATLAWVRQNTFALATLLLSLAAFVAVPTNIATDSLAAWGINFRYLVFAQLALTWLLPAWLPRRLGRGATVAAGLIAVAYLGALATAWQRFDRDTRQFEQVVDAMEPGQSLAVVSRRARFHKSWPPLQGNTHAYYVAMRGGISSGLFAGGHMPIKQQQSMHAQLDPKGELRLADYDYMLIQMHRRFPPDLAPTDGRLLRQVGIWRLYEPSRLQVNEAEDE